MTDTVQQLLRGEPQPANVADLEAALSALWKFVAEDPAMRNAVTRASALTLMVYVESEEAAQSVTTLIAEVTRQTPCRAILMIADPGAGPAGLTAWVSAHCHLPAAGEKQVCCEQISVRGRGDAVENFDNLVLSLTVPDLPVFLWWRAGRFAPPDYFQQILRASSRVLVDSASFPDPAADLAQLASVVRRFSDDVTVGDLNWARMTPWRELISQCFDAPESRRYLDRLTRVRVEYEQNSPRLAAQAAQTLLLAGWLASRLHWEPVKTAQGDGSGFRVFAFRSAQGDVQFQAQPRGFAGGGAGVCVNITLEAGGSPPAVFALKRGADGRNASTRLEIAGRPAIERTVRLEVFDEVELLNEELKFSARDRIFEEALQTLARMMA